MPWRCHAAAFIVDAVAAPGDAARHARAFALQRRAFAARAYDAYVTLYVMPMI